MAGVLELYRDYDRREIHDIFDPESKYVRGAGNWGSHGIIRIPARNDYVFFVNFGDRPGDRITEDGILAWQSQPHQGLGDDQIKRFIAHDHLIASIHLFLRTRREADYTYLGRLAYLGHDPRRERPVRFTWRILEWTLPAEKAEALGLAIEPRAGRDSASLAIRIAPPPPLVAGEGRPADPAERDGWIDLGGTEEENAALGLAGELWVLAYQIKRLKDLGREDLAARVRHVAVVEGDGAGYDILSFDDQGAEIFIEVKTTGGGEYTPFYISLRELNFAKAHAKQYRLHRVFGFDREKEQGHYFELTTTALLGYEFKAVNFLVINRKKRMEQMGLGLS